MSNSESSLSNSPAVPPISSDNEKSIGSMVAELNESREELETKIQNLKMDLQNWRSKLDTQVTVYHDQLSDLRKSLDEEVEKLRLEFQSLNANLQQQQQEVSISLKSMGLQETMDDKKEVQSLTVEEKDGADLEASDIKDSQKESDE